MRDFYMENVKFESLPEIKNVSLDDVELHDIQYPLLCDEEFHFEATVDANTLSNLTGENFLQYGNIDTVTIEFKSPVMVQRRRHKKWRINKKWAKRYGYKTVFKTVRITEAHLVQRDEMDYEIVGALPHVTIY